MKKLLLVLITLLLVACGSSNEPQPTTTAQESETAQTEAKEPVEEVAPTDEQYSYSDRGVTFTTGDLAAPIIEAFGEPNDQFTAPSCAFEGDDYVYQYDNIEINAYELNGEEIIAGMFLLDETAQTPEGLHIGSTYDEMVELYGSDYEEVIGQYTYVKGNTELVIVIADNSVVSISYIYKV